MTEDNELEDGNISGIIRQTMDVYTGKFIGLIEERQMRFEEKLGEHLAEVEAKWEEKL